MLESERCLREKERKIAKERERESYVVEREKKL